VTIAGISNAVLPEAADATKMVLTRTVSAQGSLDRRKAQTVVGRGDL
jgi:hypothetical protein